MNEPEGIKPAMPDPVSSENAFLLHKFPGQVPVAGMAPPSRPAGKRKPFWRFLIPLGLFIAIVGGIAFVVQYTPTLKSNRNNKLPDQPRDVVEFPERLSIWDPADKAEMELNPKYVPYIKEIEPEVAGHYDYLFRNLTSEKGKPAAAELGIFQPSCDCASVEAYLMSKPQLTAWEKARKEGKSPELKDPIILKPDQRKGIDIAGDSGGLIRVIWKSRKGVGELLRLNVRVWAQPKGSMLERTFVDLEARSVLVAPVLFDRTELNLGTIAPGAVVEAQCNCWSVTRSKLDLKAAEADPLINWTITPFSPAECAELEKQLRGKKINTRVKSACRLSVKVFEEKGKQQLDQGPLNRLPALLLEEQPLTIMPRLVGRVQGDVEVGGGKDQGKVNLRTFDPARGTKKRLMLRSEPGTTLTVDSLMPSYLKVQLKPDQATSTPQKTSWVLDVEVPAGSHLGPFADDCAIVLKTQTTPSRYIRIPVLGSADPR